MHPSQSVCTPPATKRPGESLAAPAAARQGVCTFNLLQGELSQPLGFWVVLCSTPFSFVPSVGVRMERRA